MKKTIKLLIFILFLSISINLDSAQEIKSIYIRGTKSETFLNINKIKNKELLKYIKVLSPIWTHRYNLIDKKEINESFKKFKRTKLKGQEVLYEFNGNTSKYEITIRIETIDPIKSKDYLKQKSYHNKELGWDYQIHKDKFGQWIFGLGLHHFFSNEENTLNIYKSISLQFKNGSYKVPKKYLSNLVHPNIDPDYLDILISKDEKYIFIIMENSDASGSYNVNFIFTNNKLHLRIISSFY